MEKHLIPCVGNWVSGDQFWDREREIELFIRYLKEKEHIRLIAQRRIGKTSLMREASRRLGSRYCCLHMDLQGSCSPEDAIVQLSMATKEFQPLWSKTMVVFDNVLNKVAETIESIGTDVIQAKLRDGVAGDWQAKGERLFEFLASSETEVIIFIDELPILVNRLLKGDDYTITPERRRVVEGFMSWIRKISTAYKGKIGLVVSGSIGLDPILHQAGLSHTITTFRPFSLEPWNADTAIDALQALANHCVIVIDAKATERIVELLGCCIPAHVQTFFSHVYEDSKYRNNTKCTLEDVERVYEKRILANRGYAELYTYQERLKMVLGLEWMPFALDLLTEAAVMGRITPKASNILSAEYKFEEHDAQANLGNIFDILVHDGYLRREGDDFVFVSKLLRDWWKAHFGFGYIPSSERKG